jgi:hypothetical protein
MKFHIISKKDLNRLIKQGDVILNDSDNYIFHGDAEIHITLYTGGMIQDIIASRRRSFDYDMDINDPNVYDPFIDGISGDYGKWFVPIWCIVEWLKKRGIL